jgi:hypothetical protein
MADFRRDWADLKERWLGLGKMRQVAAIVAVTGILLLGIWFLT